MTQPEGSAEATKIHHADISGRIVQIGQRMESLGWLSGFAADPPDQFKPAFTDLGKERIKALFTVLSGTDSPEATVDHQAAVRMDEISKELFETLPNDGKNLTALRCIVAAFCKAVQKP